MTAQILNGLIVGSMYALVAIGFTLVLGVLAAFMRQQALQQRDALLCG